MNLSESIKTCVIKKYATLEGRASRSEFWWFAVAYFVGMAFLENVSAMLATVFCFGLLLPAVTATIRRLHDINRSGKWIFLHLIPFIGPIVIFWMCCSQAVEPNRFTLSQEPAAPAAPGEVR